jgi:putative pyruvate formate lyase activating enzyme
MRRQSAFEDLSIWEEVGDRLPWYYAVAANRMPAKYRIAARVPVEVDLAADEDELWDAHTAAAEAFLEAWSAIRGGGLRVRDLRTATPSLLDLSSELAHRMLRHCNFCRWNCRVDRTEGTRHGTCQLGSASRVSTYFHHMGEELVLRGTRGSGTIFFTSCNLRCSFCQNSDISHDKERGLPVSARELAAMAWQLRMEGCHNINWVGGEPTIHLHTILAAIRELAEGAPRPEDLAYAEAMKSDGFHASRDDLALHEGELNAPMLWNSNFFMSPEAMRLLRPLMDVWLPDFKFGNDKCAIFLSRTPWYWETVQRNHKLVYDWGEDVVIRHLVMPEHVECCTKPVLKWIAENTPRALVNVMDQYHPDYACDPHSSQFDRRYRALARRPHADEILEAYDYAKGLGLRFEEVTLEKSTMGLRDRPVGGP